MTYGAQRDQNADVRLRAEVLTSGLSDWVSLARQRPVPQKFGDENTRQLSLF
jgi:hypothetical protein